MIVECADLPAEAQDLLSRVCPDCGVILRVGDWPYCRSGHQRPENFTVQADDVPGGFTIENMTPEPLHFSSKSEWKRKMKELGLENKVQHKPLPGTDKSPHTQRWV